MIRLLLVTHSLAGGGAERFAATLAGALSALSEPARFAPEVVTAAAIPDVYPLPGSVPVHRLGYRGASGLPRAVLRLRRLLRRRQPDVVLSNVLSTNAMTGAALWRFRRPPAWVARVGLAPGLGDPPLRRRFARAMVSRADLVVSNSRAMAEAVRAEHPKARRVVSRPNPVDFERLERLSADDVAAPPGPLLLAVGRLTPQKRPDLALAVLARVRQRIPAARLVWCGDGPLREATEARAEELGLAGAVDFPGFVANPFAWMRRADLLLSTSDFEGLPNALIEAQGLGLPAVVTRCPFGPDEIVADGETGLLADVGDAEALAEAAAALLADEELRTRMAAAARQRAHRLYGLAPAVAGWAEALAAVAAKGAA